MTSNARQDFLGGLCALSEATDEAAVKNATITGAFIRRGLTVAAYNLLEGFVADRWSELAVFINGGHTQFLDLPDRLQRRAIRQTIIVAQNELKRSDLSLSELRDYAENIGSSLAAVSTDLRLSPFTWKWEGSNMSADTFALGLKHVHVSQPFDTMRELSSRLGFPVKASDGSDMNLKDDLHLFAQERHKSAHIASHPVTSLWLRAVPDRVLRFGICFDILASIGALKIREGSHEFLQDDRWLTHHKVDIQFIQERKRDFAVIKEGKARATKASSDGDKLFRDACSGAGQQVTVRRDQSRMVVDWSISPVG